MVIYSILYIKLWHIYVDKPNNIHPSYTTTYLRKLHVTWLRQGYRWNFGAPMEDINNGELTLGFPQSSLSPSSLFKRVVILWFRYMYNAWMEDPQSYRT